MFKKRIDIWKNYRNEIFESSLKYNNPLYSNDKWSSYLDQIKKINPFIIESIEINQLFSFPEIIKINENLNKNFQNLNFNIESLNASLIDDLNHDYNEIKNSNFKSIFLDNSSNEIAKEYLEDMIKIENNKLQLIDNKLIDLETNVQNFSKNANQKLSTLTEIIDNIKKNKYQSFVSIDEQQIPKSFNFKKMFYIILSILIIVILITIALVIYFLVI